MKIAIVGSGFAGLACAWFYSQLDPDTQITVFDPKPISKRTSSLAFLLHAYIHPRAKQSWRGQDALSAAQNLFQAVSSYSREPFFIKRPFLKLANTNPLIEAFKKAAQLDPELLWSENTDFGHPGLWVNEAFQMRSDLYLNALQLACESKGVHFTPQSFSFKNAFDRVVLCAGDRMTKLIGFPKFHKIKGQVLQLKYSYESFKLDHALTAYKCHLIPSFDSRILTVASTYERDYDSEEPNKEIALERLQPYVQDIFPRFCPQDIIQVSSGIRLYTSNRLPIADQINKNLWVFSAMGSKGLLYHAYLGKKLAHAIHTNNIESLPKETRFNSKDLTELKIFE
ncbi:MAG: tRNA 5-methylaminomethyl-2-thiouridine biosynthesis bifunctional protein MnmC [Chlamydiae bacterium]|nr:tRNA 5-methylaminomethyl-2-thiouridine biosynthesis bifunctional protein MnmC [Chlamydiota bacterium]